MPHTLLWCRVYWLLVGVLLAQCKGVAPRSYLSGSIPFDEALLYEINQLRSNPSVYGRKLQAWLPYFKGNVLMLVGKPRLMTVEGATAVREAVGVLFAQKPLPPLRRALGLTKATIHHVQDQGASGATGHRGKDGSHVWNRAERFGVWSGEIAENIAYGQNDAQGFLLQWLVDDGVTNRSHRETLLGPHWRYMGAASGPHPAYNQMAVLALAVQYESF
ncbi:MAG: CAP domain-containing protein [Bacteroidetes Order II. Incertae sedis bacterium]|nr:CAP domain-containing protein [Bacteroidetes Order II. bacterium]